VEVLAPSLGSGEVPFTGRRPLADWVAALDAIQSIVPCLELPLAVGFARSVKPPDLAAVRAGGYVLAALKTAG
jgi:hypothetical protein